MGSRSGLPDWGVGIYASDALNLTIENTWFRDFYYDGILLTGDLGCRNVVVRGCVAWNNRRTGLAIVSASDVTVEASTFSGTGGQEPQAGVNCEPTGIRRCGTSVHGLPVRGQLESASTSTAGWEPRSPAWSSRGA
jgi:hypothetical protein